MFFTTELHEALKDSEIAFIAVGTPMGEDGSADLQYVLGVAQSIGQLMQKRLIVVDKSTVPIGTAYEVKAVIQKELDLRNSDLQFDLKSQNKLSLKSENSDFNLLCLPTDNFPSFADEFEGQEISLNNHRFLKLLNN